MSNMISEIIGMLRFGTPRGDYGNTKIFLVPKGNRQFVWLLKSYTGYTRVFGGMNSSKKYSTRNVPTNNEQLESREREWSNVANGRYACCTRRASLIRPVEWWTRERTGTQGVVEGGISQQVVLTTPSSSLLSRAVLMISVAKVGRGDGPE
ncbi:hypothetical protein P152DRAFT_512198 [Eremomyces bilateralis CBS 781.70]|uniref:Uncharacterized protein n=1 Tax=Eremomyces bilateralis CBS 781.70 TaxID=1392243 RepID=A0A6G1G9V0_9PEZI|nr:uncharacterized protein P152DRAFT_512198 [Eremomyces bilateralis CBS 781.70]KAF1814857.1 hypothetical protein P152DRAFT_512198 [Eremomyces bilateralis CBS 781.70]